MNKINLIAGLLLAITAAGANAAGTINSLSLVPATATTFDFEGYDGFIVNDSYGINGSSLSVVNGLTLSSLNQFTVGQNIGDLGENGAWGGGVNGKFLSFDFAGAMSLDVTFAQATKGFAFDFSAWQERGSTTPASVSISYFDEANSLIGSHDMIINPSLGWDTNNLALTTGYVSDSANIARVSITGDGVVLDNLTFTQAVPEPESYAMLLAGLGLMGVVARRRQRG